MTTPDVPLRIELRFELPGTPEQVWHAVATGAGISSWFLPTDVDEREGGAIVAHMGETDSPGTVTGWDPPRRFAYEEPDWAGLAGHSGAPVTPLATEFLVEATSGGSCVLRVVSSAFGTGAEWEREFFEEMERYWVPSFDHLRFYLTHFPDQRATVFEAGVDVPGTARDALANMQQALGASRVGQPVEVHGLTGELVRLGEVDLLVRLTDPDDGFVVLFAFDKGDGIAFAAARGYLFGATAGGLFQSHQRSCQAWLEHLAAPVG